LLYGGEKMKDYKFELKTEEKTYQLVFNLNVMQEIQEEYGTLEKWGELTDGKSGEVNVKALIFGLTAMMNEAIDMRNEEEGTNDPMFTKKQVGRIITKAGVEKSAEALNNAIVESTKSDEPKNE
jgi:hypothetical protein